MKRILILTIVVAMSVLTGCSSKQIQLYATTLQGLLNDYKVGVQSRIDAERKLYASLSETFSDEAERDVYEGMKIERLYRQYKVTGDLKDGRLTPSQMHDELRGTAIAEFDRTRTFFEQEMTAQASYQSGLARLSVDAKKLDALDSALKAVKESASLRTSLADVIAFGGAFKDEYELQNCKDLERQLAIKADSISTLNSQKPLDSSTKPDDVAEREAITARVTTLTAEQTALQAQLTADSHYKPLTATPAKKKCQ
jgi:hypothetical protein